MQFFLPHVVVLEPGSREGLQQKATVVGDLLTCDAICTPTATANDVILPVHIERVNALYDRSRRLTLAVRYVHPLKTTVPVRAVS